MHSSAIIDLNGDKFSGLQRKPNEEEVIINLKRDAQNTALFKIEYAGLLSKSSQDIQCK